MPVNHSPFQAKVTTECLDKHYEIQTADPGTKKGEATFPLSEEKRLPHWISQYSVLQQATGFLAFASLLAHSFHEHYTPEGGVCQVKKRFFSGSFFAARRK